MGLRPGDRLGSYHVSVPLGRGAMGEVYRAHDETLGRDVALKILPSAFAADPERLARFEREARALAALNHPHVAAIYGVVQADGVRALILEFVEGPTLAQRIRGGAIPVDKAISFGSQIAEGVEAAHEKGIVHRDLKPANIKLTPDGRVKVLDFGLARALDPTTAADPMESPTLTAVGTRAGVILGTAAYMSREQARGRTVDERADIWAFGCVLYEMLTARTAFAAETVSDTVAAVLGREPDWSALPDGTPPAVRRLLRRCLTKDARQRLRELQDARPPARENAEPAGRRQPRWRPVLGWMLAPAVIVIASGLAMRLWLGPDRSNETPPAVTRATIALPANHQLDTLAQAAPLAISPDGRRLVYAAHVAGRPQLYLRERHDHDGGPRGDEGRHVPRGYAGGVVHRPVRDRLAAVRRLARRRLVRDGRGRPGREADAGTRRDELADRVDAPHCRATMTTPITPLRARCFRTLRSASSTTGATGRVRWRSRRRHGLPRGDLERLLERRLVEAREGAPCGHATATHVEHVTPGGFDLSRGRGSIGGARCCAG
jgi:hypothetical protein